MNGQKFPETLLKLVESLLGGIEAVMVAKGQLTTY